MTGASAHAVLRWPATSAQAMLDAALAGPVWACRDGQSPRDGCGGMLDASSMTPKVLEVLLNRTSAPVLLVPFLDPWAHAPANT